ncbi:acetylxylan esterase [Phenylobacterium sp.]|uniref:alpha/beta hydrolase family protein n=1 Tax=Phenylobacterium sp. TaxID=1871053 RepID=UPI002CA5029F|nr:acetylxylan esterase [Phenylobacterium sp.]HVI34010.1 acetylxylan esterase [Phenylobacterium sp.]
MLWTRGGRALALAAVCAGLAVGPAAQAQAPVTWTTEQDHAGMMRQLGIRTLRPAPSGRPDAPNPANYDEARANPYPDWPELMTLKSGRRVTTAAMWWTQRRPEIVEDFEREVLGRVPESAPKVTWSVVAQERTMLGGAPVLARQLVGRADNSAYPAIAVDIQMTLVTPSQAKGPVPVLVMFGRGGLNLTPPGDAAGDPPSQHQLVAAGWGFATLNPASIQADNGAGLTRGIIGLTNRGQPRTPEDWGALRAWAWGASRALDYLETDPTVDAKRVGIEGVSRYGKAALVTAAFDQRFAVVLVGSSGEGGAKPHRRNFGQAVENLTDRSEYHWMAGNFMKYGAAEATFGPKDADDIPVDSHQLIALVAPRPAFISYGVPERGDALWLDQQGSWMAAVAAQPAFRITGARDLGVTEDYRTTRMPPVNTGVLEGQLAWRQHDGGHTDWPNMKHFIAWANRMLGYSQPR